MAPKPVFKTDFPFSDTKWPVISASEQDIILDLLCHLLEPIGHHRRTHVRPSKGRSRAYQQKRNPSPASSCVNESQGVADADAGIDAVEPPVPAIGSHVLVGLNSVTRHLSALAGKGAPQGAPASQEPALLDEPPRPLSLVLLPHPMPASSLPHAHLPTLVYLSSTRSDPPTRLVALSTASESRLASILQLPRVGAIGILEGAPGADALVDYVRKHVKPVQCDWLEEALKAEWKGVKTTVQAP